MTIRLLHIILIALLCRVVGAQDLSSALEKGEELYQQKDYGSAIEILGGVISEYEGSTSKELVEVHMLLAKVHMHKWEKERAYDLYEASWELSKEIRDERLRIKSGMAFATMLGYMDKGDTLMVLLDQIFDVPGLTDKDRSDLFLQKASYYEEAEELDSSIYFATKSAYLDSINQDSSSIPFTYADLGNYHITNYDYETGIAKILYGLNFIRGERDYYKRDAIELTLSNIYLQIGNIYRAEELAARVASNAKLKGYHINLTNAYNALGNCAKFKGDHEMALDYYMKSDSVNQSKSNNTWRSVRAQISIIEEKIYLGQEVTGEDLAYIRKIKEEDTNNYIWNSVEMLNLRLGKYDARRFSREYERLYGRLGAERNIGIKKRLLRIKKDYLEENGKYKEALAVDKELEELRKQIAAANNEYIIQELEAKHRKKEQELQIKYLDEQNEEKSSKLAAQRVKIATRSAALGFITLLSFFLYRLYFKVKSQKTVITKALSEKDILLREIHHRVKNNLQMVSSMLTLQSKSISDESAVQAINEGRARVRSMALIHQDLYNKDSLTDINVKDYVEKLTEELFRTFTVDEDRVQLNMEVEDIEVDIDTLIPLGLILNELVTNSIKYAWPDGRKGVLDVTLYKREERLVLRVTDDGVGYDSAVITRNSFGTTLVRALTKQLGGEMEIASENGTSVMLRI